VRWSPIQRSDAAAVTVTAALGATAVGANPVEANPAVQAALTSATSDSPTPTTTPSPEESLSLDVPGAPATTAVARTTTEPGGAVSENVDREHVVRADDLAEHVEPVTDRVCRTGELGAVPQLYKNDLAVVAAEVEDAVHAERFDGVCRFPAHSDGNGLRAVPDG
jgi:hypothetical protein